MSITSYLKRTRRPFLVDDDFKVFTDSSSSCIMSPARGTVVKPEKFRRIVTKDADYPHCWKKTIHITSDGSVTNLSKSTGFRYTWIGVKGKDSMCLVTHDSFKDNINFLSSVAKDYRKDVMTIPSATVNLSVCTSYGFRLKRKTPSETGSEFSCHEEFAARFNEQKAVNYLERKMKQESALTHEETIKAAITTFKYLLTYDFRARDIQAYVIGRDKGIDRPLSVEEIKEQLNVINKEEIEGIHSAVSVEEIKEVRPDDAAASSTAQTTDNSNSSINQSAYIPEEKRGGKDS